MDKENTQKEKIHDKTEGYYSKKPSFGSNGPSKIWQEFSKGMTYFVVIAASLIFYFALLRLSDISKYLMVAVNVLKPVIYGFLFAFVLNPIVRTIDSVLCPFLKSKHMNEKKAESWSRIAGIFSAIVFLIVLIVLLFNMLIPELYQNIHRMVFTLPKQINDVMVQISLLGKDNTNMGKMVSTMLEQASEYVQNWMSTNLLQQANDLMGIIATGAIDFVSEIVNAVVGLIISIYVLFSKETFCRQSKKVTYALFKPHSANVLLHITQKANEIFGGFLVGKIIDSAIIGVLCFFGLSILNMPYVLLVSVIVGVTNIIPFFGPYIGAVPSAILIILTNPMKGLYFIIFILILQQIDGNFIGPKILGNSTGLSSFWVIFAILLGGGLFGIPGMLLGVPTFAVIYYIICIVINSFLARKNLPEDSEYYDEFSYVDDQGHYVMSKENLRNNMGEEE